MAAMVARTTSGQIAGVPHGQGLVFRGVPYAAPPVGALRYQPPQAPVAWEGVRECSVFGPACAQGWKSSASAGERFSEAATHSEDCLYLNVYTPALDDARRPTMLWLHGGGFLAGSGTAWPYDGAAFVRDDVVLVTINYRLHALGFAYFDELFEGLRSTGNLGLLDQVAALRWVRDNIAALGGDPDNVTIFGESAGGRSAATLLSMPQADGLFCRAIPMSGSGHGQFPVDEAQRQAERILEMIDVRAGDLDALLETPVDRIVDAANAIQAAVLAGEDEVATAAMRFTAFSPVLDGTTRAAHPNELIAAGASPNVDLMVGTTRDEMRMLMFGVSAEMQERLPIPDFAALFDRVGRSTDEVYKVYRAGEYGDTERDAIAAVWGDAAMGIPAIRLAEAKLAHSRRVWMYRFMWPTPVMGGKLGACHTIELPFVFEQYDNPTLLGDSPPTGIAQAIHGAFVRFARTGDPSGDDLDWPAYDAERRAVMHFDLDSLVIDDPNAEERRLWDGVI